MDVQSLGFRTDIALLEHDGSVVEDHGTHIVVRTPHNPTFYWGNFVLIGDPGPGDWVSRWLAVSAAEFPDAQHAALGFDRPGVVDTAALEAAGLTVERDVTMTTTSVNPPRHAATGVELRPLSGDDDWAQQVELSLAGETDPHVTREFSSRRDQSYRDLTEAGHGCWFGAFVDGALAASLGIFRAGEGLARFQHVKTHPEHRRRGLAGSLVHLASRFALDELEAERLVMVADPDYVAIRVYRSVGFVDAEPQLQVTKLPDL